MLHALYMTPAKMHAQSIKYLFGLLRPAQFCSLHFNRILTGKAEKKKYCFHKLGMISLLAGKDKVTITCWWSQSANSVT